MYESEPKRTVGGPPPRTATSLTRAGRALAAEAAAALAYPASTTGQRATEANPPQPPEWPVQPPPVTEQPVANMKPRAITTTKVTFLVPVGLRYRLRAAYRNTHIPEGRETFTSMMLEIIEQECRRLETQYNGGQPFQGGDVELPKGRRFA